MYTVTSALTGDDSVPLAVQASHPTVSPGAPIVNVMGCVTGVAADLTKTLVPVPTAQRKYHDASLGVYGPIVAEKFAASDGSGNNMSIKTNFFTSTSDYYRKPWSGQRLTWRWCREYRIGTAPATTAAAGEQQENPH